MIIRASLVLLSVVVLAGCSADPPAADVRPTARPGQRPGAPSAVRLNGPQPSRSTSGLAQRAGRRHPDDGRGGVQRRSDGADPAAVSDRCTTWPSRSETPSRRTRCSSSSAAARWPQPSRITARATGPRTREARDDAGSFEHRRRRASPSSRPKTSWPKRRPGCCRPKRCCRSRPRRHPDEDTAHLPALVPVRTPSRAP